MDGGNVPKYEAEGTLISMFSQSFCLCVSVEAIGV